MNKIDPKQIEMGKKHEYEHTDDDALATKIAMDHLKDDPHYYTKLKKAGLEEEGALTPLEAGMAEYDCGDEDVEGTADIGIVAPVSPSVAVFQIDAPSSDLGGMGNGGSTPDLSSSGLGAGGSPKTLKTTNLTAPSEKNKVGPNKIVVGNTPKIGGADPLDHFGSQMLEKW